jgi:phosphate transport system substrate-binding protein
MRSIQRTVGAVFVLALFMTLSLVTAQDDAAVTVVGSGNGVQLFEALRTSSDSTLNAQPQVTGTRAGLEQLCQGQADLVLATRSINAEENTACSTANIDYTELWIAHNIVALVVPADASYAQCLSALELNTIFAPSAQVTDWTQVNPTNVSLPLSIVAPNADSAAVAVFDSLVEGEGLRADGITYLPNDTEVVTTVASTPGAIGIVPLASVASSAASIRIVSLNADNTFGCQAPSADTVEQRLYSASAPLFFYANRASLTKPGLTELLNFSVGTEAAAVISGAGLTPVTAPTAALNNTALLGEGNTRPFSEAETGYQIPADANGQVRIAGAASARTYLANLSSSLSAQYPGLTTDVRLLGQVAGVRRLCNGEIDIAVVNTPLTEEQNQNCTANNISTLPLQLGRQATVLVTNTSNPFLTCLRAEQLQTIWGAASMDTITNWTAIDPAFPDLPITLFAAEEGNDNADLVVSGGRPVVAVPIRDDVAESNSDPLYRAAATANVEGALTFMSWQEYQQVLTNNQERIQLVSVDNGAGCVAPSETTITDGSYSLVRDSQLLVSRSTLNTTHVQAFLWFMAQDGNFSLLEQAGLIGTSFGSLPNLRQELQQAYTEAAEAALIPVEATAEPSAETTPEATPAS